MNINLTPVFEAIIALIVALISYKLLPWIKARTTNEQQTYLRATIRTLVFAAEQIYDSGTGKEKLDYVENALREKGFTVDRAEIEAAVRQSFGGELVTNVNTTETVNVETSINVKDWDVAMLRAFCYVNGIDVSGCETHDDYVKAIVGGAKEDDPPTDGGAE